MQERYRPQKYQFVTRNSKVVTERKQILELQIICLIFLLCQVKIFLNFPFFTVLSCEYLREFSKKFETALLVYSGAWGKLIHEKKQKSKISWH
jgi:hypothetical protein